VAEGKRESLLKSKLKERWREFNPHLFGVNIQLSRQSLLVLDIKAQGCRHTCCSCLPHGGREVEWVRRCWG